METVKVDRSKYNELLKKAKTDIEIRKRLIEENINFIKYIARRYKYEAQTVGLEFNDLISIGVFGLIKCIDNFDTDTNNKLSTPAAIYIRNEILMEIRKHSSYRQHYKLVGDINYNEIINSPQDIENDFVEKETLVSLKKAIKSLTPKEQYILHMKYTLLQSQEEIGRKLHCSQSYVSRMERKSIKKLCKLIQ